MSKHSNMAHPPVQFNQPVPLIQPGRPKIAEVTAHYAFGPARTFIVGQRVRKSSDDGERVVKALAFVPGPSALLHVEYEDGLTEVVANTPLSVVLGPKENGHAE